MLFSQARRQRLAHPKPQESSLQGTRSIAFYCILYAVKSISLKYTKPIWSSSRFLAQQSGHPARTILELSMKGERRFQSGEPQRGVHAAWGSEKTRLSHLKGAFRHLWRGQACGEGAGNHSQQGYVTPKDQRWRFGFRSLVPTPLLRRAQPP